MQVSSDQILLALQSTWKRNEEIKSFMIMHMAWGKGVGGLSLEAWKPRGPMSPHTSGHSLVKGGSAHTCHHGARVTFPISTSFFSHCLVNKLVNGLGCFF